MGFFSVLQMGSYNMSSLAKQREELGAASCQPYLSHCNNASASVGWCSWHSCVAGDLHCFTSAFPWEKLIEFLLFDSSQRNSSGQCIILP